MPALQGPAPTAPVASRECASPAANLNVALEFGIANETWAAPQTMRRCSPEGSGRSTRAPPDRPGEGHTWISASPSQRTGIGNDRPSVATRFYRAYFPIYDPAYVLNPNLGVALFFGWGRTTNPVC